MIGLFVRSDTRTADRRIDNADHRDRAAAAPLRCRMIRHLRFSLSVHGVRLSIVRPSTSVRPSVGWLLALSPSVFPSRISRSESFGLWANPPSAPRPINGVWSGLDWTGLGKKEIFLLFNDRQTNKQTNDCGHPMTRIRTHLRRSRGFGSLKSLKSHGMGVPRICPSPRPSKLFSGL